MPSLVGSEMCIRDRNNDDGGLRIGALTIHQSIVESNLVQGGYELLATACRKIGTPQIRNMGTIGGNLCNASPSADSIPPLLVLGAKLKLASAKRWREVPLETFFIGPFQTVMENDEVLTEIIIPQLPLHAYGSYQWLTKITAIDETLVGIAALIVVNDKGKFITDVRIALSSVASMPMRANKAEDVLRGNEIKSELIEGAAIAVASEVNPRSRADYRRRMSSVLTKRVINEALARVTN